MNTLQEAARNAIKLLEELRGILYLKYEHTAIENSAKELRTALAQQWEQQPVCHGCGIPAGDVHMSTCKSGKWPSRVSNGDTAAPAPQPAHQGEQAEPEPKLWLWKNFVDGKQEYWVFDNLYPININDGDPQTLGDPCGYALFKPSRNGRKDTP